MMQAAAVYPFAECLAQGEALAAALGIPALPVEVHRFPDGESRVRLHPPARTAIVLRPLNDPNARLIELLLAAAALRDGGAARVILVTPYLGYMRQDMAFRPGEAVSQRVIGNLIAAHFDGLITVDPHLHRVSSLAEVAPGIPALSISAAPVLAAELAPGLDPRTVLVGPDSESRPWVESIASPLGLDVLVGEKVRHGDRAVRIELPGKEALHGRPAILVDDVISSGTTLIECARILRAAGATSVEAVATHGLARMQDLQRIAAAGVFRVRTTDSIAAHPGSIPLAPILAQALRRQQWF